MCLNVFELRHLLCIGNCGSGNVTSILWQVEKTAGEMGAAPESAEKFTQAAWEPFTVLCVVFFPYGKLQFSAISCCIAYG